MNWTFQKEYINIVTVWWRRAVEDTETLWRCYVTSPVAKPDVLKLALIQKHHVSLPYPIHTSILHPNKSWQLLRYRVILFV
jgi:hypothetical protein